MLVMLMIFALLVLVAWRISKYGPGMAIAAAACLVCGQAMASGGVLGGPFNTDHAELVGVNVVHGSNVAGQLSTVPDDDAGKWQILLFVEPNCPPCEALKQAMAQHPSLKALASADGSGWAALNVYDRSNRSQEFRFKDYEVTACPTVIVTTPPASKQFPYLQVARYEGFDGNAEEYAQTAAEAISCFAAKYPPRAVVAQPDAGAHDAYSPHVSPYKPLVNLPGINVDVRPDREREFPPKHHRRALFGLNWDEIDEHLGDALWLLFQLGILILVAYVAYRLLVKAGFFARSPQPTVTAAGRVAVTATPLAETQAFEPGYAAATLQPYRPSRDAVEAANRAQAAKRDLDSAIATAEEELARCTQNLSEELHTVRLAKESLPDVKPAG